MTESPLPPETAPLPSSSGARNVALVARREYAERVRTRAFLLSTILLAALAVFVALIPLAIRVVDRATVTRIAVVADDPTLGAQAVSVMDGVLNGGFTGGPGQSKRFVFERRDDSAAAISDVGDGRLAAAIVVSRAASGGLAFQLHSGDALGADRAQLVAVGAFAVSVLDWSSSQPATARKFVLPTVDILGTGDAAANGQDASTVGYANRRIVGVVFVVLSFLTLVFYGLWVASGVIAEKASRVMELLISAASAEQLVIGKIAGIGLAGLTQVAFVLGPALLALLGAGQLGDLLLGADPGGGGASLSALSPGLLLAFLAYFVLGFALYAALYAGAGSLLSRAEDLQTVALPLSIPALAGYAPAVLALSGSSATFIRVASFVPLWSPFVMLARLSAGHVEPWELALSLGLLLATVPVVTWLAIRVYRAGVLIYGQPPTVRTFLGLIRGG